MSALERRRLAGMVRDFARVRLLVVGDLMLDEYLWGEVERVSPEAPVPVVQIRDESAVLGGAANVVHNVLALGGSAVFCSMVGDDAAGRLAIDLLKNLGVDPRGVIVVPGRPTTRKSRVIARSQQVVRFDRETLEPPGLEVERLVAAAIEAAASAVDGVVIQDYAKGLLTRRVASAAMRCFRARGIPVCVDAKASLSRYRGSALVKPNLREVESLSGLRIRDSRGLARAAARLRRQIGGGAVAVTRGARGMTLFEGDGPGVDVPTVAREVFDVQGAGDTAIAALALALRSGASLLEAAVIANAAAGVVVGKVATATAGVEEVCDLLPAAIDAAGGPA